MQMQRISSPPPLPPSQTHPEPSKCMKVQLMEEEDSSTLSGGKQNKVSPQSANHPTSIRFSSLGYNSQSIQLNLITQMRGTLLRRRWMTRRERCRGNIRPPLSNSIGGEIRFSTSMGMLISSIKSILVMILRHLSHLDSPTSTGGS